MPRVRKADAGRPDRGVQLPMPGGAQLAVLGEAFRETILALLEQVDAVYPTPRRRRWAGRDSPSRAAGLFRARLGAGRGRRAGLPLVKGKMKAASTAPVLARKLVTDQERKR